MKLVIKAAKHWCNEPPCEGHVCDKLRGPATPSKLRMYRALATRAGVPRSRP
jgi:hypothetical protein